MSEPLAMILKIAAAVILSPLIGGLLTGFDRVLSAKMQRRKGPPLLQPFYDVIKLFQKEETTVNTMTRYFLALTLIFSIFTVALFFAGMDLLLCIFAFTLACVFFVVSGYSSYSPYSFIGTEREMLQIMCYEPMILLTAFGHYEATGSFSTNAFMSLDYPVIGKLPFIFLGLAYVLTIKLRKSPFDLSMAHHGHQEVVKGITTEFTGASLGLVEIIHWYETVFALGLVFLFFAFGGVFGFVTALLACFAVFVLEIVIDNTFARVKWKSAILVSWIVTGIAGGLNLLLLSII